MNLDTPLSQVALMLPLEAAQKLMYLPEARQTAVLAAVRRLMTRWESSGVVLDPFTLGVVLTSVIIELLAVIQAAIEQIQDPGR